MQGLRFHWNLHGSITPKRILITLVRCWVVSIRYKLIPSFKRLNWDFSRKSRFWSYQVAWKISSEKDKPSLGLPYRGNYSSTDSKSTVWTRCSSLTPSRMSMTSFGSTAVSTRCAERMRMIMPMNHFPSVSKDLEAM